MKVAIITDTHFGVRGDSSLFHDATKKFLSETFFPYLRENQIDKIVHLGDLVDRRKYVNFMTSKRLREDFLEPINSMGIETIVIAGNHDTFFKNTNEVNALRELVSDKYETIRIVDSPTEIQINGLHVLLLPWICVDNYELSMEMISRTHSQVCMGHLELSGFQMYRGHVSESGMSPRLFDKFDVTCSGHYHHKSSSGGVHYLGSHMEFTWSDYGDPRGFHVFDTRDRSLQFIENPIKTFKKVWYDDSSEHEFSIPQSDFSNSIVKVIVKSRKNPVLFDRVIDHLEKSGASDLQVVEDHLNLENISLDGDSDLKADDTLSIFKSHVSSLQIDQSKKVMLERVMMELYAEALSVE